MDALAFTIFSFVFAFIVNGFDELMGEVHRRFIDSLVATAVLIETVYIMHYGYLIVFEQRTDNSDKANLRELLYHMVIVAIILSFLKLSNIQELLNFVMALRQMVAGGLVDGLSFPLINSSDPLGKQAHESLIALDLAMSAATLFDSFSTAISTTNTSIDAPQMKSSAVTLALISDISPTLSAGILLLINELMVRLGIALFPLVLYCTLYDITRDFFYTWLEIMFSAGIQLGVSVILIQAAVPVTVAFGVLFTALSAAKLLSKDAVIGSLVISEMQVSLIQAGFGLTLSAIFLWAPTNAASFAGKIINDSVLKQGVGTPVSARGAKLANNNKLFTSKL